MNNENVKTIITKLMEKNFLVSPNIVNILNSFNDYSLILENINKIKKRDKPVQLSESEFFELTKSRNYSHHSENIRNINHRADINVISKIPKDESKENVSNENLNTDYPVIVLDSYEKSAIKKEMSHFVSYFKERYKAISKILQGRQELQNAVSISRLKNKQLRDKIAVIGLVLDYSLTKNNNLILTLEDPTGTVKVILNKNKNSLSSKSQEIVLDEVIGVTGSLGSNVIFADEIYFPEIPISKEYKKSPDEVYAAFISDIHVGSNMFLPEDFNRFINWINGKTGTEEQKIIAKKIKYLFVIGDLVDGVGIYPDQDSELVIKDINEQYAKCAEYLGKIRNDINIIICGGNHDAIRIAEPQPKLDPKYAEPIYKLKNVKVVSNPAFINIHKKDNFPGFDVLIYHGYSFDYYVANVDYIRNNGGYDKAEIIMEFLLKKRHLAPSHSSTLYIPDNERDPLVIDKVPDFFVTGHIHKASVAHYNNITMICSSCWQAKTSFQEKVGHNPQPSIVPVVNLKTRDIKLMRFGK